MSQLAALSLSIGLLGGIATWAFLSVGGVLIWAAFVAWGCFFHTGGDVNALRGTIVGNLFGAVVATVAALVILTVPGAATLGLPLWAGIVVAITAWGICIAANIKLFSVIPANVYGYACTFAFLLQTPDKLTPAALTSLSMDNGLIAVGLSMVIGALLGFVSGKLGAALTKAA
ncbi:MAG: hypothetical protein H6R15_3594 [Proteobacteria bacterium]|nr:hypothetical protein [Pseudomonadota bacterium]